ncbi:CopD family protein [Amphibiibacter pelophylacis]|uniref:CopD family protein n=1 Tax=Amphibiibacter pelophylacis TaxID=1799477 RepID=A0ACC6NXY7_9BURK
MDIAYLSVKTLHIIFVAAWFAGLFYLPRLLVNLAMVPDDSHAERERLLLMAGKLHRFSHMLMGAAIVFGLVLWLHFGIGQGKGWVHAKLVLVVLAIIYQMACKRLLAGFEARTNTRSHGWYRVFNEVAIVLFAAIVALAVFKPF